MIDDDVSIDELQKAVEHFKTDQYRAPCEERPEAGARSLDL